MFTRGWDNVIPSGNSDADTIDDLMREMKIDIYERFLMIFDQLPNSTDDQLVNFRDHVVGRVPIKQLYIHGSEFVMTPDSSVNTHSYGDTGILTTSNGSAMRAPLKLPVGTTVRKIRWLITGGNVAAVALAIVSMPFDTSLAQTVEHTMDNTASAVAIKDSGAITMLIEPDTLYYLKASKSAGTPAHTIHGVEVSYECPDSRFTR